MCYECEQPISEEEFECDGCLEKFCSEICRYKHEERRLDNK